MKKQLIALAMLISVGALQAQNTVSEKDKKFILEASRGNVLEIRLGELAQTNGFANEVKIMGQRMVADHTKANDELKALAQSKNVTVPYGLTAKEQMAYEKLAQKHGDEFDKAYAKFMVKDHKKDVCEFKKEAKHGSDTAVKNWASNTVAVLEQHKQMWMDTCKAVHKK